MDLKLIEDDGTKNIVDKVKAKIAARDATIVTQAQTIERLADALEFALTAEAPSGWTMLDIQKAEAAARALLAEIRGKHA